MAATCCCCPDSIRRSMHRAAMVAALDFFACIFLPRTAVLW
jgi:hypothetical protein